MYKKTIIRFGFCDIQNNQDFGKGYQPQPSASADNPYLDLDYSGYHKILINNCLQYHLKHKEMLSVLNYLHKSRLLVSLA